MSKKLTRWFPKHVSPARSGIYQTRDTELAGDLYYNFWDGRCWYYGYTALTGTMRREWTIDQWPDNARSLKCWRGLAKEPK